MFYSFTECFTADIITRFYLDFEPSVCIATICYSGLNNIFGDYRVALESNKSQIS